MNHTAILHRAAQVSGRHRTLWPFGALVVLTAGAPAYPHLFVQALRWSLPDPRLPPAAGGPASGAMGLVLTGMLLLWALGAATTSYLSEGALVGMVEEIQLRGATTVHHGLRTGWARLSQVLGIALVAGLPLGVVLAQLSLPLALPLLWPSTANSLVVAVFCSLWPVSALFTLPLTAAMNLFYEFMLRQCLLQGMRVRPSIRQGCCLLRQHLRRALPVWLSLLGVSIASGAALALINLLGLFAVTRVAGAVWESSRSLAAGALVALPCFLLFAGLFVFLQGLYIVFYSTAWTLAYREVTACAEAPAAQPQAVLVRA